MPMRPDTHVAPGTPGAPRPRGRPLLRENPVRPRSTDLDRSEVQAIVAEGFHELPEAAYLLLEVTNRAAAGAWLEVIAGETRFAADPVATETVNVAFTHAGLRK